MPGFILYLTPALLYALLAILLFITQDAGEMSPLARAWRRYAILVPLFFHAYLLCLSIFGTESTELNFNLGNSISTIVWFATIIIWAGSFIYNMKPLQIAIAAIAAISVLLPGVFHSPHFLQNTHIFAFKTHMLIALLAYSLFAIAAMQALLMNFLEKRLHHATMPPMLKNVPPLLTMETLLFRIIGAGFVLLTLTLFTGIQFSEELFGKPLQFNHKTVFAFISWTIFAVLLGGRHFYGWRGRIAVRSTLTGFSMLILAYIGSKFVLEVILQR